MQAQAVKWFNLRYPHLRGLLFAVPNGGARSAKTGAVLKREGVVSGVSDLLLLVPNKEYHGICLEAKTSKGKQTDNQKKWQEAVERNGYRYVVFHSVGEFIDAIEDYLRDC